MTQVPNQFRAEARRYVEACEAGFVDDLERLQFARAAFVLAQLAEILERNIAFTPSLIGRCELLLESVRDVDLRAWIASLLQAELLRLVPGLRLQDDFDQARLSGFLDDAIAAMGADMGTIQLLDPAISALKIVASRGFDAPFLEFFALVRADDGDSACGTALKQANRVVISDVAHSPIFVGKESEDIMRSAGVCAVQSTPVIGAEGNLLGIITTHWRSITTPGDEAQRKMDLVVHRAASEFGAAFTRKT